jgi:hypothetical protein
MDPATLASTAVALLSPYLEKIGDKAAEKLGDEAPELGSKLLGWLRTKLPGRGQEAVEDLAAKPDSEDNQADLRKQLAKALAADPALAKELAALLPQTPAETTTMTQAVSGAGAKAAQVKGSQNQTTIG